MPADYRPLLARDDQFERLCAILSAVAQHGSLRKATEVLGVSYRYAWGLVRRAEEEIGTPLLVRKVGGPSAEGPADADRPGSAPAPSAADARGRGHHWAGAGGCARGTPAADGVHHRSRRGRAGGCAGGRVSRETGQWVRYIAAGSGQALDLARAGRVDLALVHAAELEERFLAEGYGTGRHPLAQNDFVVCGPAEDPQASAPPPRPLTRCAASPGAATPSSAGTTSPARTCGNSGCGSRRASCPSPLVRPWPLGGQGNIATLRHAAAIGAYTLIDSATLVMACPEGTQGCSAATLLVNQFCLIPVNPELFPAVNGAGRPAFRGVGHRPCRPGRDPRRSARNRSESRFSASRNR